MNTYGLVIFDMDGTLLDSGGAHDAMFRRFWERYADGRPPMDPAGAPTIWDCFRPAGISHQDMGRIYAQLDGFYRHEAEDIIGTLHFVPQARDVLISLRRAGIRTALVSNSHAALVDGIIRTNDAAALFDVISGSTFEQEDKPERLVETARQLGISPAHVLYAGDNEADGRTARRIGVDCVIILQPISWIRSADDLLREVRPTYIVYTLEHVLNIAT